MKLTRQILLPLVLAAGAATLAAASDGAVNPNSQAASGNSAKASPAIIAPPPSETGDAIWRSQALRRQLSSVDIASVAVPSDPNAGDSLMEYVRQLGAMQLPQPKTRTAAAKAPTPVPAAASKTPATPPSLSQTAPNQASPRQAYNRKLENLLQTPAEVVHALAAAEALYEVNDWQHAAAFYRLALERMSGLKNPDADRIAWILFQLANCLRIEDPAGAAAFYQRLATQYPNSPWTAAAAVQLKCLIWYGVHRPDQLLEKYARDPNSL